MAETRRLRIDIVESMSARGVKAWSPPLRRKLKKKIFKNTGGYSVPYSVLAEKELFGQWLFDNLGANYYYIYSYRWKRKIIDGKKKYQKIPYLIAKIELTESGHPRFHDIKRISKYRWFDVKSKERNKKFREGLVITE